MLRIIGGRDKGRKIKSPKTSKVRPIHSSIRKVLFDTLGSIIYEANFLDVFAGVGTVGLEALSRGAKRVFFVERDGEVLKVLRENVKLLGYEERAVLIKGDAFKVVDKLKDFSPFDVIYLGPPYSLKRIEILPSLYLPLLSQEGVLVIQHHHKSLFDFVSGFDVKVKRIGENQLTFYHRGK